MDVRLEDGTIVKNVPEGMTRAELMERLSRTDSFAQEVESRAPPRTALQKTARQLGLTGRAIGQGAYDVLSPYTNAVAGTLNLGLGLTPTDYRFPEQTGNLSRLLTQVGVPEPENKEEELGNLAGRFATGFFAGQPLTKAMSTRMGVTPPQSVVTKRTPSTEEIRTAAQKAYQSARDAGVNVSQKSFKGLSDDILNTLRREGYHPKVQPKLSGGLEELAQKSIDDISFDDLEITRRIFKNAAGSIEPDERRLAQLAINKIDDFVQNLSAKDTTSGDPKLASKMIQSAREFYTRFSKSSEIENLYERALNRGETVSGSGLENALRIEFRRLAQNPRRLRVFNVAEQEAIKKVARGGPVSNAFRDLGKYAPTGLVSSVLGGGAGYAVGGPVGAGAVLGIGAGARGIATNLTKGRVNDVSRLIRGGASQYEIPQHITMSPIMKQIIFGAPPAAGVIGSQLIEE